MEKKNCNIYIDQELYSFDVEGDFNWGNDEVLYSKSNGTIKNTSWENEGFSVASFFSEKEFKLLYNSIEQALKKALLNIGFSENDLNYFTIEKYHEFVKDNDSHNKVISQTRELRNSDLAIDVDALAIKVENYLGIEMTNEISEFGRSHVQVRISRPNSLDINPPHRDSYLSFYRDIINLWIPVCGCNHQSSLPVVPESHKLTEKEILKTVPKGAKINGNIYNVPCLLTTKEGDFKMIRPNPSEGEVLIFTPYLIHGAAMNLNKDLTRISLELRFSKK